MASAGQYAQGAAGGAAAGTAILPGWGTAIGAGVGLLGAYLGNGNDQENAQLSAQEAQARANNAAQLGPASQSAYSAYRGQQQDLANRLDAQSRGQGPSLAAAQLQSGLDQNMAQQASFAAGGRGGQAAVGAFAAANNSARLGAQTDQQAAQARIQEIYNAQTQLGSVLNQGRSSDEANNQFNAQQQNYADEANLKAKLQAQGYSTDQIDTIINAQQRQAGAPGMGSQILAGGVGAYGMASGQRAQSAAAAAQAGQGAPAPSTGYSGYGGQGSSVIGG